MNKYRIIHVITGLATGGAEMMLYKLLSMTDRSKFDHVVISLAERGALAEKIEALNIPVYSLNMQQGKVSGVAFWRLLKLMRNLQADILQGWMYHGNLAAQLAALFLYNKTPVIWNIRGTHTNLRSEKMLTAFTIWLGAIFSRFPYKIINNSEESACAHERDLGYRCKKVAIIPNGFDTKLFMPSSDMRAQLRSELGLSNDAFLIGLVGRYHPMKDHDNFLKAAAHLLLKHPSVHFVLIGKGVDTSNSELIEKIILLHLTSSSHLLGMRSDLPYLTAALDIAVSSSAYGEGFPNVIGEAMSCCVPCVVTNVGSSAWIVGNCGRVVPPRDSIALAQGISELIEMNSEKRSEMGLAARQRVINNFSLDAIVKKYEALYEEVYTVRNGEKQ